MARRRCMMIRGVIVIRGIRSQGSGMVSGFGCLASLVQSCIVVNLGIERDISRDV